MPHTHISQPSALSTASGRVLDPTSILPCGQASGSDLFVRGSPTEALEGGATPAPPHPSELSSSHAAPHRIYAKPGSAIAASQAKRGENSYYYSVGKHRAPSDASERLPQPRAVSLMPHELPEQTISTYSMLDDGAVVKVYIPLAGATTLATGAVVCDVRARAFDLRVATESALLRLHVPILYEEIEQGESLVKARPGKLVLVLKKKDKERRWYELRKTKGIGDAEFNKIVPDGGEAITLQM